MQDSLAQGLKARSSVSLSLDELETGNLPLGLPLTLHQTFTGFPTQGEADEREDITQSDGATGIGSHDLGEPLGEDLAGAG